MLLQGSVTLKLQMKRTILSFARISFLEAQLPQAVEMSPCGARPSLRCAIAVRKGRPQAPSPLSSQTTPFQRAQNTCRVGLKDASVFFSFRSRTFPLFLLRPRIPLFCHRPSPRSKPLGSLDALIPFPRLCAPVAERHFSFFPPGCRNVSLPSHEWNGGPPPFSPRRRPILTV